MAATGNGFFVYVLRCVDGTYYVGSTSDLLARVETHNSGRGPRFTACRRPVVLVYSEPFSTMDQARQREIQLKKWSRAKKEALIAGNIDSLHNLSRRRNR
jgi:putative endonuclease